MAVLLEMPEILLRNMLLVSPGPCRTASKRKNPPPPLFIWGIPIALREPAPILINTAQSINLWTLRSPHVFGVRRPPIHR